jgi:hypothetical protein
VRATENPAMTLGNSHVTRRPVRMHCLAGSGQLTEVSSFATELLSNEFN